MKIASGIISIILGLIVFLQSCTVGIGGAVFDEESAAQGGGVGIFVALLYMVGGAFAFALPKVALVVMAIAGVFGIATGTTTSYKDMTVWGVIALVIAVLNFFGGRKPKKGT